VTFKVIQLLQAFPDVCFLCSCAALDKISTQLVSWSLCDSGSSCGTILACDR